MGSMRRHPRWEGLAMSATFPALPLAFVRPGFGDTPVGAVVAFAGDSAGAHIEASGWMPCDGRTLAAASYPELFVVLGYLHGGSDEQFCLPDYRGSRLCGHAAGASAPTDIGVNYLIKFTYGLRTR